MIDAGQIASGIGETGEAVDAALTQLGTRGLAGFDLAESAFFHRELPFDVSQVEKLQPRLIAARKLIEQDQARLHKTMKTKIDVRVAGSGVEHRVTIGTGKSGTEKCTCPWFNKHETSRGPCKHILAARILLEETEAGGR